MTETQMEQITKRIEEQKRQKKNKRALSKRKNLSNILQVLQATIETGFYEPGDIINTKDISNFIGIHILEEWFTRDGYRADSHGLTRSLGDIIGGHGLHLLKVGTRKYRMPDKLPVVQNDVMYEPAVYPDGWVDPRLGPDAVMPRTD